tara:strand:+ start:90 stop:416 length:327 start_codon:yes stop_codon:yes gene_type:complete
LKKKKIKIYLPDDTVKNRLLQIVLDYDRTFYRRDNVYFLKRAFFVNSAINHLLREQEDGKITVGQLQEYITYLERYVKNKINLYWKNGQLTMTSLITRGTNGKEKKTD